MYLIKKLGFVGGFAVLCALPVVLGACGNKGPLYLPPVPTAPTPPAVTVPATSTAPSTPDDNSRAGTGLKP